MVYLRHLDQDQVLIAFNRSPQTQHVNLPVHHLFAIGSVLKHELASGVIAIQDGMIDDLTLAPYSGVVLSKV
jgi:hypothetical protein